MPRKPKVWFVDDLQENLDHFDRDHGEAFEVTTFLRPADVLERLKQETPDALLCHIFFYETPEQAAAIEQQVTSKAKELRAFAHSIHADDNRYLEGIGLLEDVATRFGGGSRFPVYAFTSKGPYLLGKDAWDRIARAGADVLLKNRFGTGVLRSRLEVDIEEFRRRNSWAAGVSRHLKSALAAVGLLGWVAGLLFDWLLEFLKSVV